MGQRGRTSAAELAIARPEAEHRIAPPGSLGQLERSVWLRTVNSQPADWFGEEHITLLTQYCRHVSSAEILSQQINAFDPQWFADDDGLKRYELLTRMLTRETANINSLMRAMRLTQQSTVRAEKVKKKPSQAKTWLRKD
jgi:hypothetical protein